MFNYDKVLHIRDLFLPYNKIEMKHRSVGKENVDCGNVLLKVEKNSKSLFKKKAGECFFTVETNVESKSNQDHNHDVIVD